MYCDEDPPLHPMDHGGLPPWEVGDKEADTDCRDTYLWLVGKLDNLCLGCCRENSAAVHCVLY